VEVAQQVHVFALPLEGQRSHDLHVPRVLHEFLGQVGLVVASDPFDKVGLLDYELLLLLLDLLGIPEVGLVHSIGVGVETDIFEGVLLLSLLLSLVRKENSLVEVIQLPQRLVKVSQDVQTVVVAPLLPKVHALLQQILPLV